MVIIKIKGFKAGYTKADGWKAEVPELTAALNAATKRADPRLQYIVDWENWVAEQMLDEFGGEAVSLNWVESKPGVLY